MYHVAIEAQLALPYQAGDSAHSRPTQHILVRHTVLPAAAGLDDPIFDQNLMALSSALVIDGYISLAIYIALEVTLAMKPKKKRRKRCKWSTNWYLKRNKYGHYELSNET